MKFTLDDSHDWDADNAALRHCFVGVVRNGRGESCGARATVLCIDAKGFTWFACDEPEHRARFYQCDGQHLVAVQWEPL